MDRLVVFGDKAYLIDTTALRRSLSMFDPMPMLVTTPPQPPGFRIYMDHHLSKLNVPPSGFMILSDSCGPDPWQFKFLFPLGKRAYVRKS